MRRMSASNPSLWPARVAAFILAAAAAGSLVVWGLQLRAPMATALPAPPVQPQLQVDAGVVARALGAATGAAAPQAAPALTSSRMALVGVLAHGSQGGAALIAVDGKPPKPVTVGGRVGEDWVLASVAPRRAVLRNAAGAGDETFTLEMPPVAVSMQKTASSP
jgi:general secretion pathway protein C